MCLADFLGADTNDEDFFGVGNEDAGGEGDEGSDKNNKKNANTNSKETRARTLLDAKLAMVNRDWGGAAEVLLSLGRSAGAVAMYRSLGRLDMAGAFASSHGNKEHAELLTREFTEWLKNTGQEERCGEMKQAEGDFSGAVKFYLKGGLPGKAAACVISAVSGSHDSSIDPRVIDEIVDSLTRARLFTTCGSLFLALGRTDAAMDAFVTGDAFGKATSVLKSMHCAFPKSRHTVCRLSRVITHTSYERLTLFVHNHSGEDLHEVFLEIPGVGLGKLLACEGGRGERPGGDIALR